ncbi:AarF/ABC1/UbiB kinase family protein [Cetobacterium sp.]|uniref:AarF/ABC1/UbiB kinase family protein n=1 Tax=Cetobacterium sp. TaxID=2071632 RepID=UPI002FC7FFEB
MMTKLKNKFKLIKLLFQIYSGKKPDLKEIEKMGLLAIKICQYYALRVDFLNPDVCLHLSKLYENSYSENEKELPILLEKDVGILKLFSRYDVKPFASASIGQIHLGVLKSNNEKVAIKVIRKNSEKEFKDDIKNSKKILKILLFFYPKLRKVFNPLEAIEYIENSTLRELNFKNELEGAKLFERLKYENNGRFDLEKLKFSEFIEEYCTERILISKFIEGESFNTLLDKNKLKYEDLLLLFKYHSFYMFKLGVFHGDIHPGNIIIDRSDNINLIDCSTIGEINDKLRIGLFGFFYYLSRYDYINAAKYLNKMSIVELDSNRFEVFLKSFINLYSDFKDSDVSKVSLTKRMMETIKLGVNSGMEFPQGMFHVIKSLMYLDGMVLKCNPHTNLMTDIKEFTKLLEKEIKFKDE